VGYFLLYALFKSTFCLLALMAFHNSCQGQNELIVFWGQMSSFLYNMHIAGESLHSLTPYVKL